MHWISDPEERKRVIGNLRGKPWDALFSASAASVLATRYCFRDGFDLADALSEMLWRYKRRVSVSNEKPFSAEELSEGCIASISTAVALGLWKARYGAAYARRSAVGRLAAAARENRSGKKRCGRPENTAAVSLMRTLGAIYEDGTGKKPFITRAKGQRFRGNPYRFACDVCAEGGLKIPVHFLREMEFRGSLLAKGAREIASDEATAFPAGQLNNLLNIWIKK